MTVHFNRKAAGGARKKRKARPSRTVRRAGLRRVELLVPDVRVQALAMRARRQVRKLAHSRAEQEELDFIEAVQANSPLE